MNRREIQLAVDAIVAASADWMFVAVAEVGEPLRIGSPTELVVPGGVSVDPAYFTFLTQANGLSVRTYRRDGIGAGLHVLAFEVVGASHILPATEAFRARTNWFLEDDGISLRSYPHEPDRRVLNESICLDVSSSEMLLWSTGQAESGVFVLDYEYLLQPNFLTKVASSFDEYLECSLRAMLENEGLSVYW